MIMQWQPLIEELREIKADCQTLSQQNMNYSEVIGAHCRAMKEMETIHKHDLLRSAAGPGISRDMGIEY